MKPVFPLIGAAALGLALAATAAAPPAAAPDATLEAARSAAQDFSGRLKSALQAKLEGEGPVAAIDFCHDEAPRIAETVMAEHGVRLGRIAVPGRVRNPGNAPTGWQGEALAGFARAVAAGGTPSEQVFVQREGLPAGTALRLARAIEVEAPCLACHGTQIAEPVAAALRQHYPGDAATGFSLGDLRGALWVEVPATPAKDPQP